MGVITTNPKEWYEKGIQCLEEEGPEESFRYFEEGLSKGKEFGFLAFKGMGISHNEMGSPILAVADFKGAIKINANDPKVWKELSMSYYDIEKYKEAEEACLKAINLNPKSEDNWLLLGNSKLKLKDETGALNAFKRVLEINPKSKRALKELIFINIGFKKYTDVIEDCNSLLKMAPEDSEIWNALGVAKFYLNDFAGAETAYRKAAELDSHGSYSYNIGEALWKQNKMREALEFFEKSIKQNPSSMNSWIDLAQIYSEFNRKEESEYCKLWAARIKNSQNPQNPKYTGPEDKDIPKIREIIPRIPDFLFNEKPTDWYSMIQSVSIVSLNQAPFSYELGDLIVTMQKTGDQYTPFFETDILVKESLTQSKFNWEIWNKALNTGDIIATRTLMAGVKVRFMKALNAPKHLIMIKSSPRLMASITKDLNIILIKAAQAILPELVRMEVNFSQSDWDLMKNEGLTKGNPKFIATKNALIKYANLYWDIDLEDVLLKLFHILIR